MHCIITNAPEAYDYRWCTSTDSFDWPETSFDDGRILPAGSYRVVTVEDVSDARYVADRYLSGSYVACLFEAEPDAD